jgi:hypothetical protein
MGRFLAFATRKLNDDLYLPSNVAVSLDNNLSSFQTKAAAVSPSFFAS